MVVADISTLGPNAPEPRRWTLDEYVRLDESGLLGGEGERYELLNGEIIRKLGQNLPHIAGIRRATAALAIVFREGHSVGQQVPIHLGEDSPEPDVSVLKGEFERFDSRWPDPGEILLFVEVVDSRPDTARNTKVDMYARHGIAEYWILDVRTRTLEVRRGPRPSGDWTETRLYGDGESVAPLAAPSSPIAVADLLPSV